MLALIHKSGRDPPAKNCWTNKNSSFSEDFNRWGCKVSGPGALFPFKASSLRNIVSFDKLISDNESITLIGIVGILSALSSINVDLKSCLILL